MEKDTRNLILGIGIMILVIAGGYGALVAHTGFGIPFSSVVSESMQHDNNRSQIGVIDTGDIVIVSSPDKVEIQSYVRGTVTGFRTFGEYGSVIIYERNSNHNPVIHRAMVWLDYDSETGTWSSDELRDYKGEWHSEYSYGGITVEEKNPDCIRGILYFINMAEKTRVHVNLENLQTKNSGYLTMGDNKTTNGNFDQSSGIIGHLIPFEDIRSVPIAEIPWLAVPKLVYNDNTHLRCVPNSLPSLVMITILMFITLLVMDLAYITKSQSEIESELESKRKWKKI